MRQYLGIFLTLALILLPLVSFAQFDTGGNTSTHFDTGGNTATRFDTGETVRLDNPLAVDSFCKLINLLLQAAMAIGIPIAVLFIVYAGFKFVLARGSPSALAEARSNFLATVIGIAIFVGAGLIAVVIINTLSQLGLNITTC